MTIKFALNKNEVDSSKKLAKALADKFKVKSAIAEEKEDVCVAKNGFKFEAKYVEGGCNVEVVIPEWVTTEVNALLLKNFDMLASAVDALKSGFEFLGYAIKGIKKDIREVFEKHRND